MSAVPPMEGTGTSKVKGRRGWTIQEENNLVLAFRDIIGGGWKSPNGYRSGFLVQLEQKMKDYMPRTDLKDEPHISSKYTSWKKTYHQISNALSFSGMNWNSSTFTVEAEPGEWESFLQQFPNHSTVRGKPFPLYEAWVEIFGKDRATGHNAMDWSAAAEPSPVDLSADRDDQQTGGTQSFIPTTVPDEEVNQPKSRASQPPAATDGSDKKNRKRGDQKGDQIVETITNFCHESTKSMRDIASRLGAAKETMKRQEDVFEAIGSLPMFIDIQDHINVSNMLVNNPNQLNMFFGMNTTARQVLVQMAIEGKLR